MDLIGVMCLVRAGCGGLEFDIFSPKLGQEHVTKGNLGCFPPPEEEAEETGQT